MVDRYTKVLLTVMVGWGAVKVLVPEVRAFGAERVYVEGGYLDKVKKVKQVEQIKKTVDVKCRNC
jgi:hypothetical protein